MKTTNPQKNHSNLSLKISFSEKLAIQLLIAMHTAGIVGLSWEKTRELFLLLVPLNLIVNLAVVLYFHKIWTTDFALLAVGIFLMGFFVEVVGVQTKAIFGDYWYKTTLGYKLWGVPVVIGINWLIVIYASQAVVCFGRLNTFFRILLATFLTVFLDTLIEPVAMRFDFWDWQTGKVPLQNYLGWSVVALLFHTLSSLSKTCFCNKVAVALYFCEVVFFITLQII